MTPREWIDTGVLPAYAILPARMGRVEATAMLTAIALQESRLIHRVQIGGPAHGFLQFERGGGVHGVNNHASTKEHAKTVCAARGREPTDDAVYEAIVNDDVLAAAFGRLLLWTVAGPLPQRGQHQYAWEYYISGWRPGQPHRHTWDAFYDTAWQEVLA